MNPCYYDRQGQPMEDTEHWEARFDGYQYLHVAETILSNGMVVSTTWNGFDHQWFDHQYGEAPPLIFDTRVFPNDRDCGDLECARYSTEAEASAGHAALCAKWGGREDRGDQS